jgi:hypothetical protein
LADRRSELRQRREDEITARAVHQAFGVLPDQAPLRHPAPIRHALRRVNLAQFLPSLGSLDVVRKAIPCGMRYTDLFWVKFC